MASGLDARLISLNRPVPVEAAAAVYNAHRHDLSEDCPACGEPPGLVCPSLTIARRLLHRAYPDEPAFQPPGGHL